MIKNFSNPKGHQNQWFISYGNFTEGVDFAYWWSGEGSAPAGCAAGLFLKEIPYFSISPSGPKSSLKDNACTVSQSFVNSCQVSCNIKIANGLRLFLDL